MRKRFAFTASVMALILVAAACASSGSTSTSGSAAASTGQTFPISITVDNNLQSIKAVTVTIVRPSGGKILGTVASGRRQTFSYDAAPGSYAFSFRTTSPTDPVVTSNQIQIAGPASFTWHLQANALIEGQ